MAANFPFLGGSFNARSSSFDAQRTVNLYAEMSESGSSRSVMALMGTPGLAPWATVSETSLPMRGMIAFSATQAIVVCGTEVYSLTTSGGATLLTGPVFNNSASVSLASNGQIIMMVTGGIDGYFIDPAAMTVTQITDPDFVGGTRVDYIDGYFIWAVPGSGKFQVSQLYGTAIDSLDFATAEGAPDPLVTCIVDHREVWLLGSSSTEVWYNAGGADFPLQRIQGAFLEIGCAAPGSVAKLDNSIFWLASDERGFGTVQRASGYTPTRVSNHAVEYAIAGYSTISDAVAYTYSQEGHSFYVLTFPTANATWCLDVSTGLWHERQSLVGGVYGRHRSNCQMNFAGMVLVGDYTQGRIFEMDLDTFIEDESVTIRRVRVAPHLTNDGKYEFLQSLELFMQTGTGMAPDPSFSFMGASLPAGATLTRATIGTYYNASGILTTAAINAPRFTYDPTTLAYRGLLIEPAATNRLTYSEDCSQPAWAFSNFGIVITTNDYAAPNGLTTADKTREDTSTGVHRLWYVSSSQSVAGQQCTYTVFVQPRGRTKVSLTVRIGSATDTAALIDLVALTTTDANFVLAALPGGWVRIQYTYTAPAAQTARLLFQLANAAGSVSYTGDGASAITAWGCQFETGPGSSYIATGAATASRSADVLTLNWGLLGVSDGTVTIRYQFDDGTTQDVATVISGGLATVPAFTKYVLQSATLVTSLSPFRTPVALLSWSDDGGYSFGNQIVASIGLLGARETRVKWRRLGRSRDRVFKVEITDPIRVVFTGSKLTATPGAV